MATPVFIGNHSRAYMGHGIRGTGDQNVPVQMGWGSMAGKAGEVGFIQLSSMVTGDINQGVFFQSEVEVTVEYTLCNPGIALSPEPENQDSTMWTNPQTVAPNSIVEADHSVFTVIKVTFNGSGTLYLGVR